jgi:RNA 3'-terminal phosphate cyclase (ATP)
MVNYIELDGSFGEGGGQILRSSLTLSLLTGKPFRLHNIRAGRPKPGLQPQHLMSVRAAAAVCGASLLGASKNSSELTFQPGEVVAGSYRFDIGTAGATGLVLQTIALPLALRGRDPSEVTITGGTHVKASPCFHFLETTWAGYLRLFGLSLSLTMRRSGFYPRGGGEIHAHIQPIAALRAAKITEALGAVEKMHGFSAAAGLEATIAERQARRAVTRLKQANLKPDIRIEKWQGGPGTVIALILPSQPVPTLFFGLGERGKPAERVADEAVDDLFAYIDADGGAVDPHSADQLLLPLVFADGESAYATTCVTQHLLTNIEVVRLFVDREIQCEGDEGEPGRVTIRAKLA